MSEIILDLGPRINDEQIDDLLDVLHGADYDDEITIALNTSDAHEADDILEVLEERCFGYYTRGGGGEQFYIVASKKYFNDQR